MIDTYVTFLDDQQLSYHSFWMIHWLSFRMINTFIYLSERLTPVTFLDDRRGTSSGGGITVTSGDLGLLSRRMGGASGGISSVCPRGVFSLGDNIGSSISFNPSFVLDGEKRLIKASDPFTELQCFKQPGSCQHSL